MNFADLRQKWSLPAYPAYHQGLYLEEYFYNFYKKNKHEFDKTGYTLIPVFWTMAYWLNQSVQSYIDCLPKKLKYFCVCQHDDAVKETLPEGTIVFSAGGNSGGIPIPLVCSSIDKTITDSIINKNIFCSFVGSCTHSVRSDLINFWKNDSDFYFKISDWSLNVDTKNVNLFFNITKQSKFVLCPRGYGAQSFRFYEALQLGSVPVYIHDDNKWMPYSNLLNWQDFAVIISSHNIPNLKDILLSIDSTTYQKMLECGKNVYREYFCLQKLPYFILNTLNQNENN